MTTFVTSHKQACVNQRAGAAGQAGGGGARRGNTRGTLAPVVDGAPWPTQFGTKTRGLEVANSLAKMAPSHRMETA